MFGFGSKKEKQPEKPWVFQVLTTEYLIEGQLSPIEDFFSYCQTDHPADWFKELTSVQLQATGILNVSTPTLPNWNLAFGRTMIALIPRDAESVQAAREAYEDYTTSRRTQLFTGHYLIQGQLLNEEEQEIDFEDTSAFIPMTDVEITHLLPNANLRGYRVPWILVNGDWVHGYSLI